VLSGRGLCDELITRPEESYRLWCVVVCDLETSRMRRPWPALGRSATRKKRLLHNISPFCTKRNTRDQYYWLEEPGSDVTYCTVSLFFSPLFIPSVRYGTISTSMILSI